MRKNCTTSILLTGFFATIISGPCLATNPDISTIEQPVNLTANFHMGWAIGQNRGMDLAKQAAVAIPAADTPE